MKHDAIYGPNGLKIFATEGEAEVWKSHFKATYSIACSTGILNDVNGDDIQLPLSAKEVAWLVEQQGKVS